MMSELSASQAFYRASGKLVSHATGAGVTACTSDVDVGQAERRIEACMRATRNRGVFIFVTTDAVQLIRVWTAIGAEGHRPALHAHLAIVRDADPAVTVRTLAAEAMREPPDFLETGRADLDPLRMEATTKCPWWSEAPTCDAATSVLAAVVAGDGHIVRGTDVPDGVGVLAASAEVLASVSTPEWSIGFTDGIAAVSPVTVTLVAGSSNGEPAGNDPASPFAHWLGSSVATQSVALSWFLAEHGRATGTNLGPWLDRIMASTHMAAPWLPYDLMARLQLGESVGSSELGGLDRPTAAAFASFLDWEALLALESYCRDHVGPGLDAALNERFQNEGATDASTAVRASTSRTRRPNSRTRDVPARYRAAYASGLANALSTSDTPLLVRFLRELYRGSRSEDNIARHLETLALADLGRWWPELNRAERRALSARLRIADRTRFAPDEVQALLSSPLNDPAPSFDLVEAVLHWAVEADGKRLERPVTLWDVLEAPALTKRNNPDSPDPAAPRLPERSGGTSSAGVAPRRESDPPPTSHERPPAEAPKPPVRDGRQTRTTRGSSHWPSIAAAGLLLLVVLLAGVSFCSWNGPETGTAPVHPQVIVPLPQDLRVEIVSPTSAVRPSQSA